MSLKTSSLSITVNRRIRSVIFVTTVSAILSLCTVRAWCRLAEPPYMVNVRDLAERSPIVFRGRISTVFPIGANFNNSIARNADATFHVDRWYRGRASANPSLNFRFDPIFSNGHNCIDFQPNSYWIVFAVEKAGHLELIDDCSGALTVSALLGPDVGNTDWLAQMGADFIAGLDDSGSDARLASIQRLGGLKLASSRAALHRVIEQGSAEDSKWAIYAALRTGDVTVLQTVKQLLANGDDDRPERAIASELRNTTEASAVPDLISILDASPGELTKRAVLTALGENLRDPRSVPSLGAHLSDPDHYVQYNALVGLRNITHEGACALPAVWKEYDVEPKILQCKSWWEQEGKFRNWMQN